MRLIFIKEKWGKKPFAIKRLISPKVGKLCFKSDSLFCDRDSSNKSTMSISPSEDWKIKWVEWKSASKLLLCFEGNVTFAKLIGFRPSFQTTLLCLRNFVSPVFTCGSLEVLLLSIFTLFYLSLESIAYESRHLNSLQSICWRSSEGCDCLLNCFSVNVILMTLLQNIARM